MASGLLRVVASIPTAGVGFTIRGFVPENFGASDFDPSQVSSQRDGVLLYGLWTVAWARY